MIILIFGWGGVELSYEPVCPSVIWWVGRTIGLSQLRAGSFTSMLLPERLSSYVLHLVGV